MKTGAWGHPANSADTRKTQDRALREHTDARCGKSGSCIARRSLILPCIPFPPPALELHRRGPFLRGIPTNLQAGHLPGDGPPRHSRPGSRRQSQSKLAGPCSCLGGELPFHRIEGKPPTRNNGRDSASFQTDLYFSTIRPGEPMAWYPESTCRISPVIPSDAIDNRNPPVRPTSSWVMFR